MLRVVTKENCNNYKKDETRNNPSLRKKNKVPGKSEVFYLASDSYHITGRITEHVLPVLCSVFRPV
jgi:hypothetical protein